MAAKSINRDMDGAASAGEKFAADCVRAYEASRGDVAILPHALNHWVGTLVAAGVPIDKIKLALGDALSHSELK